MPAVTADTLTLPKHPDRRSDGPRPPGPVGDDRAVRLRGRGLPGAPGVRRRRSAASTRSSTWTRWARSTTRRTSREGTDWHPHRGFETVTYIIDGTFQHQDSHGGGGVITNGATQWMTAGGGILHIETPPEELVVSGGLFHGIQLWVNLPAQGQDGRAPLPEPRGRRSRAAVLARRRRAGPPDRRRRSPATRPRRHPHADHGGPRHLAPGARLELPWRDRLQRARLRARRARARSAPSGARSTAVSSSCSAPATRSRSTARRASRSRCCCSAAARSVSRSPPTARS